MASIHPIEIIGGGLAGLSLGLALRRQYVPVTLFESGEYPRHHVCGEFIAGLDPRTTAALGLDEILADAFPNRSVRYYLRDRALASCVLPAPAWGISRHTLDHRVANAFAAAGGNLRTRERGPEDGLRPGRVFSAGRRRRNPLWVGLKMHVRGLELTADLEVHLGHRAYLGMSRVEDGAVNVCGIFGPRAVASRGPELILDYLEDAGMRAVVQRLRQAECNPDSVCVTAASLGDRFCAPPDRIRIGDACATIPPYTGNGLAMALQGAEAALPILVAYARGELGWPDAVAAVGADQRRRFRRRLMAADLLHPFFIRGFPQAFFAATLRAHLIPFQLLYSAVH